MINSVGVLHTADFKSMLALQMKNVYCAHGLILPIYAEFLIYQLQYMIYTNN